MGIVGTSENMVVAELAPKTVVGTAVVPPDDGQVPIFSRWQIGFGILLVLAAILTSTLFLTLRSPTDPPPPETASPLPTEAPSYSPMPTGLVEVELVRALSPTFPELSTPREKGTHTWALEWLANSNAGLIGELLESGTGDIGEDTTLVSSAEAQLVERFILAVTHRELWTVGGGNAVCLFDANQNASSFWLSPDPICNWEGVVCRDGLLVTDMVLSTYFCL